MALVIAWYNLMGVMVGGRSVFWWRQKNQSGLSHHLHIRFTQDSPYTDIRCNGDDLPQIISNIRPGISRDFPFIDGEAVDHEDDNRDDADADLH